MFDLYFLVYALVVLVLIGVAVIWFYMYLFNAKKEINKQKEINNSLLVNLKSETFNATKIFYFSDKNTFNKSDDYKKFLAVDSVNKKLGLVEYETGKLNIVDFASITNYELYENGAMVTSGVGVMGLGLGSFSMQTSGICKELKLIIRLNNLEKPQIVYEIVSSKGIINFGIGKNSQIYRVCFPTVQEVISLLQLISKENDIKKSA